MTSLDLNLEMQTSVSQITQGGTGADGTASSALPGVVLIDDHGVRWQIEDGWQDRLLGSGAPDWFALHEGDRAHPRKFGHRRSVWEVRQDDKFFFAKLRRNPRRSLPEWFRGILGLTSTEREWKISRAAKARGVPTVHFVGMARRNDGGHSPLKPGFAGRRPGAILISEGLADTVTLSAAWTHLKRNEEPQTRRSRAALIDAVARLYAIAHRAGLFHQDNHPQNILVEFGALGQGPDNQACGATPRAYLVDLLSARLSPGPIGYRKLVFTMAQLEHHFRRIASRSQRLRFLYRYFDSSAIPISRDPTAKRSLLRAILDQRNIHASDLARRRDRRIGRSGRYFTVLRPAFGMKATVVLDVERRHVFPESDVDDFDIDDWAELLEMLPDEGEAAADLESSFPELTIHVGYTGGVWRRIGWSLFGTPFGRFFKHCHRLRHRDIGAPLPLAYITRRSPLGLLQGVWVVLPARLDRE